MTAQTALTAMEAILLVLGTLYILHGLYSALCLLWGRDDT